MKKLFTGFVVAAVFTACTTRTADVKVAPAFDLEKVKTAIAESNKTYGDGFAKGDSSLFINKYTKDGCIMPANAPKLCGAAGVGGFFKGGVAMGVKGISLITDEVIGGPEVVVETGVYNLLGDAGKVLDKGKFVVVWKEEDGKWKMHRDIFTTDGAGK
jgi:ketosteroid isomerase-like protein